MGYSDDPILHLHKLCAELILQLANLSHRHHDTMVYGFASSRCYIDNNHKSPTSTYHFHPYNSEDILKKIKSSNFLYLNYKTQIVNPRYATKRDLDVGTMALKALIEDSINKQNVAFSKINQYVTKSLEFLENVQNFYIDCVSEPQKINLHWEKLQRAAKKGGAISSLTNNMDLQNTRLRFTALKIKELIDGTVLNGTISPQMNNSSMQFVISMIRSISNLYTPDCDKKYNGFALIDIDKVSYRTIEYALLDLKFKRFIFLPLGYRTSEIFDIFRAQLSMVLLDINDSKKSFKDFLDFNFFIFYALSKALTLQLKNDISGETIFSLTYSFWDKISNSYDVDKSSSISFWENLNLKNR